MRLAVFALLAATIPVTALTASVPPVAASRVVRDYYDAIDRGAYRTAYLSWDNGGRASGQSYAAFRSGFAQTLHTRVSVGRAGRTEGAAGSAYVTVPVDVNATLRNGRHQHFSGSYTLRRINDDDPRQSWHLYSAKLAPVA